MKKESLKDKKRFMEFDFNKDGKSIPQGSAYFIDIDIKSAIELLSQELEEMRTISIKLAKKKLSDRDYRAIQIAQINLIFNTIEQKIKKIFPDIYPLKKGI